MHGIETIRGMNARNQEAAEIMAAHGHTDAAAMLRKAVGLAGAACPGMTRDAQPTAVEARFAKANPLPGGVQPWSAGELFPGVITVTHAENGTKIYTPSYRGQSPVAGFSVYEFAANWIASRKAEFSKGVRP